MAVWGDNLIKNMVRYGMITSDGEISIGNASLDVRLGHSFKRMHNRGTVMLGEKVEAEELYIEDGEGIIINSGEFMLATTMEYIKFPQNVSGFVHGRSSIGRLGLTVQNAGYIDPGFEGEITLELRNDAPYSILLVPGYRVAQIVFEDSTEVSEAYHGKYQNQKGATSTRMHEDGEAKA